jgi:hypothetical protein
MYTVTVRHSGQVFEPNGLITSSLDKDERSNSVPVFMTVEDKIPVLVEEESVVEVSNRRTGFDSNPGSSGP